MNRENGYSLEPDEEEMSTYKTYETHYGQMQPHQTCLCHSLL